MTYRQAITLASNRLGLPNEVLPSIFFRLPERTFKILDEQIEGDPMEVVRGLVKHFRKEKDKRRAKNPRK